jgi:hypothetical protein
VAAVFQGERRIYIVYPFSYRRLFVIARSTETKQSLVIPVKTGIQERAHAMRAVRKIASLGSR